MIYGTLTLAKQYAEDGKIHDWLQHFLRADGKNIALADGLIEEDPCYIGPVLLPIHLFADVKDGAPEYLHAANDIQYFFEVVDGMKQSLPHWDAPPLIAGYVSGQFQVHDGRHRLEMYRQLGVRQVWSIVWFNREKHDELLEILKNHL